MLPKAFQIEDKIVSLKGKPVLIDRDVAQLYGVPTKRINEAVKNNQNKFPQGYVIPLTSKSGIVCGRNIRPQTSLKLE